MSQPPPRTGFVTVTAMISVVLAAIAVVTSALLVMFAAAMPDIPAQPPTGPEAILNRFMWILDYRVALTTAQLALALVFLAASWGLLRRREWGRWLFIGLLVLTALGNFAGLVLVNPLFDGLIDMYPAQLLESPDGAQLLAQMQFSKRITFITTALGAVGLAALHGWLAWKLCTPEVRAEFS
jgi:hypothetical protein